MNIYEGKLFGGFSYDKPDLIHLETHTFKLKLKNADGTAADLSGFVTAECAVNNTFDHTHNELMAYAFGNNCQITDAAAGEITITLDCNTIKFGNVVRFNAQLAYLEVNLFDTEAKLTRVLLDRVECRPHVRDQEGAPVSGDPQYYNKAETNALIEGKISAVTSVNGKTGAVELDAADVGAISELSQPIVSAGTAITPEPDAVYRHTLAANDSFTVDTSALTSSKQITFELHLIQGATAVSFTLPSGILWADGNSFSASNPVPEMTDANTLYCIVIRWDGSDLLANLAYSKTIEVSA